MSAPPCSWRLTALSHSLLRLRFEGQKGFSHVFRFFLEASPVIISVAKRRGGRGRLLRSFPAYGFTLLELLVVMVIIGLLAGYVAPRYFSQVGKSEIKVARAQIDAIEKALDQYRLDIGRYPTTEQGLTVLVSRPSGEPKWAGPYLKKDVPPDPWGKPYQYKSPGDHGEYDLLSFGRDGQPGGSGEAADITNW